MMEEDKKPIKYINLNNINIKTHKYISKEIDIKDNYNRNTYSNLKDNKDINLYSTGFAYNKLTKENILKGNDLDMNKNNKFLNKISYIKNNGNGGMSTEKKFSKYENNTFKSINSNNTNNNKMKKNNSSNKIIIHETKYEKENENEKNEIKMKILLG
jgi:hypothetical protein